MTNPLGTPMWWRDVLALTERLEAELKGQKSLVSPSAEIATSAILDDSKGPIVIGSNTTVCTGAIIIGPVIIGCDCLIGNNSFVRGPIKIGNKSRIGFSTELKNSIIGQNVVIGPQCFVADTRIDDDAYLGAMVRTSNHRLDHSPISVLEYGEFINTGSEKLGCWIGKGALLGIQVIVLPGRVIAPNSVFEPRITISRNLPAGHYRVSQVIQTV